MSLMNGMITMETNLVVGRLDKASDERRVVCRCTFLEETDLLAALRMKRSG